MVPTLAAVATGAHRALGQAADVLRCATFRIRARREDRGRRHRWSTWLTLREYGRGRASRLVESALLLSIRRGPDQAV
jgi:hypothetical protein